MSTVKNWEKVAAGRRFLKQRLPYLDPAVTMLAPIEAPGLGTVAVTENMILLVDMAYIEGKTIDGVAADLAHEVSHVLRDTFGRSRRLGCVTPQQLKLSNIAADMAINPDIKAAGLAIEEGGCAMPSQLEMSDGLLHEEYYWALCEIENKEGEGSVEKKLGLCGGPACGSGHCGSGGGMPVPGEPGPSDPAGRKPAELDRTRRAVAAAIQEEASKGRGNIPAGWVRWADTILEPPKVSWRQKIARATRNALRHRSGAVDSRFKGVSRRQAGVGYGAGRPIMPVLKAPIPEVEVWFDTSGSMSNQDLADGMSELIGVIKAVGADVVFGSIDAGIHSVGTVKDWRQATRHVKGGGGTDYTQFFERLRKEKIRGKCIIFLSDGDAGGVPETMPTGNDYIWLITKSGHPPCAWGQVIKID